MPSATSLVAPSDTVPAGGGETQIWLIARLLASRGWRVCLVVSATDRDVPDSVDGVSVLTQPSVIDGRGRFGRLTNVVDTVRTLNAVDPAVVVQRCAGVQTGVVGLVARLRGKRFVYSSANVVDFDLKTLASIEDSRATVAAFRLGVALADAVVVQTLEQKKLAQMRFKRASHVIRSVAEPIDVDGLSPETFLWVGRLVDYKRPLAYVELARSVPQARFRMVGVPSAADPELSERVEAEAAIVPNLELLPPRSREGVGELINTAIAVVNTADYEGMPNVFLEAWARGVPALSLTHDPDGVITSNGVGGFANGSPERLAALTREMWEKRTAGSALSERCRAYVSREHSEATAVRRWEEVLFPTGDSRAA